jgi:hypothetical protein
MDIFGFALVKIDKVTLLEIPSGKNKIRLSGSWIFLIGLAVLFLSSRLQGDMQTAIAILGILITIASVVVFGFKLPQTQQNV